MNCIEQGRQKGLKLKELKDKRLKEEQHKEALKEEKTYYDKMSVSGTTKATFKAIFDKIKADKSLSATKLTLSTTKHVNSVVESDYIDRVSEIRKRDIFKKTHITFGRVPSKDHRLIYGKAKELGITVSLLMEILIKKEYPQYFKVWLWVIANLSCIQKIEN